MPGIGVGIGIPFRKHEDESSYWTTREPSGVAATITGSTTATVTWTDSVVSGADGYKVYAGAVLKATVAVGAQTANITGLNAETEYIFKVVAYKGAEESVGDTNTNTTWNAVFDGIARAWSLSESGMRREALGSGDDFFPVGATSDGDFTILNGSSQYVVCGDGDYKISGGDTSFTIAFTVKPTALSGARWLGTKGLYSNPSGCEWYIYHNGTQVYLRLNNGAADTTVTDATNRLTNGTTTKVVFGKDAVNNIISIKIGNNAPVTAAFDVNSVPNLCGMVWGTDGTLAAGNCFNGAIKDIMIWNGKYLTAAEQATLHGLDFPFGVLPEQAAILDPDDIVEKYCRHDFSDLSTLFQDAAKTTAVASDDDPIRVAVDPWNGHDLIAAADAARPLSKAAIIGGLSVGLWSGGDKLLKMASKIPGTSDFTLFLIVQNNDNASGKGSQPLINSDATHNYLAITGTDYAGGDYAAMHTTSVEAVVTGDLQNSAGFNVIEVSRSGSIYKIMQNGKTVLVSDLLSRTGDVQFDQFGGENTAGWWFDGYLAEWFVYTRCLTTSEKHRIRKFLQTKWTTLNQIFMQS